MADRPTKPGFYWAQLHEGGRWRPVEVSESPLVVSVLGYDADFSLSQVADWGPEIMPPEGLRCRQLGRSAKR